MAAHLLDVSRHGRQARQVREQRGYVVEHRRVEQVGGADANLVAAAANCGSYCRGALLVGVGRGCRIGNESAHDEAQRCGFALEVAAPHEAKGGCFGLLLLLLWWQRRLLVRRGLFAAAAVAAEVVDARRQSEFVALDAHSVRLIAVAIIIILVAFVLAAATVVRARLVHEFRRGRVESQPRNLAQVKEVGVHVEDTLRRCRGDGSPALGGVAKGVVVVDRGAVIMCHSPAVGALAEIVQRRRSISVVEVVEDNVEAGDELVLGLAGDGELGEQLVGVAVVEAGDPATNPAILAHGSDIKLMALKRIRREGVNKRKERRCGYYRIGLGLVHDGTKSWVEQKRQQKKDG